MNKKANWNYQNTVTTIEEIIKQIESGALPLEDVFAEFAKAQKLLSECEAFLAQGKTQMNLLIETLKDE